MYRLQSAIERRDRMAGFGGSVFLADLDADYITPSQACVNPLFNGAAKTPGRMNNVLDLVVMERL